MSSFVSLQIDLSILKDSDVFTDCDLIKLAMDEDMPQSGK